MSAPRLTVILPTRNPDPGRWLRVFSALAQQTLDRREWEIVIVDNASDQPSDPPSDIQDLASWRRVMESDVGLTPARLRGLTEATGEVAVFVDDDNVLAPGYLAVVQQRFAERPRLAAAGGPVVPEFEATPPAWTREFWGLLALHEHGANPLVATGAPNAPWPPFAPVGAGLSVRCAAAKLYAQALAANPARRHLDRAGRSLASGGDNDLVFTLLHAGGDVGYFPELRLTHLIPSARFDSAYLARLNEGIQRTWVRVLALHGQCPWTPIAPWTLPLRTARSWWCEAAWRSPAHHIRWRGLVGRFSGLADLHRDAASVP